MITAKLNIVVALACEARFFLDQYQLTKLNQSSQYSVYTNADKTIHLIISGIGKIRSAAALSYLHGLIHSPENTCYLNAGIAGSGNLSLGSFRLIDKIYDQTTKKRYYPWSILFKKIPLATIVTVDQPSSCYPGEDLVDMEASGFFQSASSLVTQEQVQVIKIVSDNSLQSQQQISSSQVVNLFQEHKSLIESIVSNLLLLSKNESKNYQSISYYSEFINRFHFTDYQSHQLRELLRRWQVNYPNKNPLLLAAENAEMVLKNLHIPNILCCD